MNIDGSISVFLSNSRYQLGLMTNGFFPESALCHWLLKKRFATTRNEESAAENSDDVFLAQEESPSFKQQVALVITSRNSANTVDRNFSHAGVPGVLCRRSLYSSTSWLLQASTTANRAETGTQSSQQEGSWTGIYFRLLYDQVSYTFEIPTKYQIPNATKWQKSW